MTNPPDKPENDLPNDDDEPELNPELIKDLDIDDTSVDELRGGHRFGPRSH